MYKFAVRFFALLFAVLAVFFIGYAGNTDFNAVQSFGALFLGLVHMTIAGIMFSLTSTPTTE